MKEGKTEYMKIGKKYLFVIDKSEISVKVFRKEISGCQL